ncbi:hypothetical protein M433DRAFT_288324 [Acidomyces richmondensis BFW]|nr:MAG: hypothetical protein FE78DRAFT_442880 [Acidomyces sp. 'richmondensis']KYG44732.1 hypothetical protein M433DRAFT_288324 [Acidomyces richmondensis BFW]
MLLQPSSTAMDHLCPRLSFPLAPCLSCLSRTTAIPTSGAWTSRRTSSTNVLFGLAAMKTHPTLPSRPSTKINQVVQAHTSSQIPTISMDAASVTGDAAFQMLHQTQSLHLVPTLGTQSKPEQRKDSTTAPPILNPAINNTQ